MRFLSPRTVTFALLVTVVVTVAVLALWGYLNPEPQLLATRFGLM